jgi:hypothetical protein
LARRVYCRVLRKKISSLIERYSGSSERERRAYEEEPERQNKSANVLDELVRKTVADKFNYGSFVFTYYRFLDKFHVEPKTWAELMEFSNYLDTDSAVSKLIAETVKQEK